MQFTTSAKVSHILAAFLQNELGKGKGKQATKDQRASRSIALFFL